MMKEVRLKKSYDYFKTLKDMSDCIGKAFSFRFASDKYKKEALIFYATRKELSNKLSEEFVAPIERNDIYNISSCLVREMLSLEYLCLSGYKSDMIQFDEKIMEHLNIQGKVIIGLSNKLSVSLLGDLSSVQSALVSDRNTMLSCSREIINKSDNILLKYICFEKLLRFTENIGNTFYEIERVIINNI